MSEIALTIPAELYWNGFCYVKDLYNMALKSMKEVDRICEEIEHNDQPPFGELLANARKTYRLVSARQHEFQTLFERTKSVPEYPDTEIELRRCVDELDEHVYLVERWSREILLGYAMYEDFVGWIANCLSQTFDVSDLLDEIQGCLFVLSNDPVIAPRLLDSVTTIDGTASDKRVLALEAPRPLPAEPDEAGSSSTSKKDADTEHLNDQAGPPDTVTARDLVKLFEATAKQIKNFLVAQGLGCEGAGGKQGGNGKPYRFDRTKAILACGKEFTRRSQVSSASIAKVNGSEQP